MASERQERVKGLVKGALATTLVFTATTIVYLIAQNTLQKSLERKEASEAFSYSLAIDHISIAKTIETSIYKCKKPEDPSCLMLLTSLLNLRNRYYDYSILMTNTLGYSVDSQEVNGLKNHENFIATFIYNFYGTSLENAKTNQIYTPEEYIDSLIPFVNELPIETMRDGKIEELLSYIDSSYAGLQKIHSQIDIQDKQIERESMMLRLIYMALVGGEIILFIAVNVADFMNNAGSDGNISSSS